MSLRRGILVVAAVLALGAAPASAGPIAIDGGWYEFGFGGVGTFGGTGVGFVPTIPPSNIADDAPWTFSGEGTFTVLDLFLSVDQFELFDFGVSLGLTSAPVDGGACGGNIACAEGDARYSSLSVDLGAGDHSITIQHVAGAPGAAVFRVDTPVPEPASALLLGAGLAGLVVRARRRRQSKA